MDEAQPVSKADRLAEIVLRLEAAPAAANGEDAYELVAAIINQVEDKLTSTPNDPDNWMNDGRIYPPQWDNAKPVPGRDDVTKFRTRRHYVLIATNGAIEIHKQSGEVILAKPGADGRTI